MVTPFNCRILVRRAWKTDQVWGWTLSAMIERSNVSFRGKLEGPDSSNLLKKVYCPIRSRLQNPRLQIPIPAVGEGDPPPQVYIESTKETSFAAVLRVFVAVFGLFFGRVLARGLVHATTGAVPAVPACTARVELCHAYRAVSLQSGRRNGRRKLQDCFQTSSRVDDWKH